MDFFDKLGKKVSETYNAASEKTANFAKETKLRMEISENKDKIDEEYKKIGKKLYEKYLNRRDEELVMWFIDEFKNVDMLTEAIKNRQNEILDLTDKKKCANCGETYEGKFEYCPKCGAQNASANPEVMEGEILDNNENRQ